MTNLDKDGNILPIMHGENFLLPVDKLPDGEKTSHKEYIVGHSETGHHHVISGDVEVVEVDNERFMLVNELSKLWHQKSFDVHETIEVQPGVYKITDKSEYDPFQQILRKLWD